MTVAVSGKSFAVTKGKLRVTCIGGTSLIEINQDSTGWAKLSGGDVDAGVIATETAFVTEELGGCLVRFTGAGTVSYTRIDA